LKENHQVVFSEIGEAIREHVVEEQNESGLAALFLGGLHETLAEVIAPICGIVCY